MPRKLLDLVSFQWGTYSRFGHFMLPTHYDEGPVAKWFHGMLSPVKWGWWRIVELMFKVQFSLSGDLIPSQPIEINVFNGGQILNYEFRDMVKAKKVVAKKGAIHKFTEDSVVLQDGTEIPCDMVVYATGFAKSYHIFDRLVQQKLGLEKDGLYLYRNMLPPQLPNIAFIGAEVSTFNNILTHGLQAKWLQQVLSGKVELPNQSGKMMQVIEKEQAWKRTWMPGTSARASIFQLHMMKYHDQLVKDMGEPHRRKGANFLAEIFAPYRAADYKSLFN